MSPFAFSSDRPLRTMFSAQNAEFKAHITELVGRAYFNLKNAPLAAADTAWANAIIASAVHICSDERVATRSTRALVHLFEDIIRVSEEHVRESRRHAAMATNTFYLRETVLDALSAHDNPLNAETSIVRMVSETSRLQTKQTPDA